jgi:hypothetical protein
VLDAALHAAVEPGEHDLERVRVQSRLVEERRERRPRPLCRPDGFRQPRLARGRTRGEEGAAVAGTLERHGMRLRRARLKLGERELQRPLDPASTRRLQAEPSTCGMSKWIRR